MGSDPEGSLEAYRAWEQEFIHRVEYRATDYAIEILISKLMRLSSVDHGKHREPSGN